MNEFDVIKNLECCMCADCSNCSRFNVSSDSCRNMLLADAKCVIKMQYDAFKCLSEDMAKLKEENARLRTIARFSFDEKTLVDLVNELVYACYIGDDDADIKFCTVISYMKDFAKLLPSKHMIAVLVDKDESPKLVKQ